MTPHLKLSDADLQRQRAEIRHGLYRANTAIAIILTVVVTLATGAFWRDRQAAHHAALAHELLWQAEITQASAYRRSGELGQRRQSLNLLARAAAVRESSELRNEAVAALALTDLRELPIWKAVHGPLVPPDYALDSANGIVAMWEVGDRGAAEIVLWRAIDGTEIKRLKHQGFAGGELRFSKDGRWLAVRYYTGEVGVWEVREGRLRWQVRVGEPTNFALDFSAGSEWLAVLEQSDHVRLFRVESGQEQEPIRPAVTTGHINLARFHPKEQQLAVAAGNEIQIWDLASRVVLASGRFPESVTSALAWHPNGETLAVSCWFQREIYLWNTSTGARRVWASQGGPHFIFSFHPDGHLLAARGGDGVTRLWDVSSGRLLLQTHTGLALAFLDDRHHLIFDRENSGIGLWEVATNRVYQTFRGRGKSSEFLEQAVFSANDRYLAFGGAGGAAVLDLSRGVVTEVGRDRDYSAFLIPGTSALVTAGENGLLKWEGDSFGTNNALIKPRKIRRASLGVDRTIVAIDEKHVFVVGENTRMFTPTNHEAFFSVAISPDQRWIAVGTHNLKGFVLDAQTGAVVHEFPGQRADVAFDPLGRWLATGSGQACRLWTIGSWQLARTIPREAANSRFAPVAFSPKGDFLAMTRTPQLLALLDPSNGKEIIALEAPSPLFVSWLAFNEGGSRLAASSEDGVLQLWHLDTLVREMASLGVSALRPNSLSPTIATPRRIGWFAGAALVGVGLAAVFAFYTLRRHRMMIDGYSELDALATRRREELHQARETLALSEKMQALGTLAAGIAHDFNNLLSVIRLANQFVARGVKHDADLSEETSAIEHAVQQGKSVVRAMLGYSRHRESDSGPVIVADVVGEVAALLGQQFLSGIRLTLDLDRSARSVAISRGRLEQILLNLVVNASEAMKAEGQLIIMAKPTANEAPLWSVLHPRANPSYVQITVTDSGPGIPENILPRIFEPFFTTKNVGAQRGTGLGLSTVYAIAEQDGLGLAVESELGKGTIFRLLIPESSETHSISDWPVLDSPTSPPVP